MLYTAALSSGLTEGFETMRTLRSIASETERQILIEDGLIEERHLDATIDAQQDRINETYYWIDDLIVVLRDQAEPTAYPIQDHHDD